LQELPDVFPEEEEPGDEWFEEEEEDDGDTTRAICQWIWPDLDAA